MSTAISAVRSDTRHRSAENPENTARSKIEKLVRAAKFDYDAATDDILEAMRADSGLRSYVQREGARYLARNVTGNIREAASIEMRAVESGAVNGRHRAAIRSILDEYTLPGGTPIGDARRAELKAAIEYYATQEAGMRSARKVCELVGKKLPDGKRVREIFTDAQLRKIVRESK
jgi:hypothetical protein